MTLPRSVSRNRPAMATEISLIISPACRATMVAPNADQADFGTFHGLAVGAESIVLATGVTDGASGVVRRLFVY